MPKKIRMPFKGSYKHSQEFGVRSLAYARFGLDGHDGDDFLMPLGTKILSPVNGIVHRVKDDPTGWGLYLRIWDRKQNLLVNLCHMSSINLHEGDVVKAGDEVARSGNTGNSSAPHLHIAFADTGGDGKRLNIDNGFKGWYSMYDKTRIQIYVGAPNPSAENSVPTVFEVPKVDGWMAMINQKLDLILEKLMT